MSNIQQLKTLVENTFPIQKFYLVRYTYVLKNEQGKVLLINSKEANFPGQIITHQWEIFSDNYFFTDLYNEDHFLMAQGVIEQRTGFEVAPEAMALIALHTFEYPVKYHEGQVARHNLDAHRIFEDQACFLNLYYYVDGLASQNFSYWSDLNDKPRWLLAEKALDLLDITYDKPVLESIVQQTYTELLKPGN